MVQDPNTLTVECDKCGTTIEMDTTQHSGDPTTWGIDEQTLKDNEWCLIGEETFCPECKPNGDIDE